MLTLPAGGTINPTSGVTLQSQPTLTWVVDPGGTSIVGTDEGFAVMQQAVEIILNVQRFQWQIYTANFGMDYRNLIGGDPGVVASNLQRRLKDAFSVDDRITGISNYEYSISGDVMTVSFTVKTVYGNIDQTAEVVLG